MREVAAPLVPEVAAPVLVLVLELELELELVPVPVLVLVLVPVARDLRQAEHLGRWRAAQ